MQFFFAIEIIIHYYSMTNFTSILRPPPKVYNIPLQYFETTPKVSNITILHLTHIKCVTIYHLYYVKHH
jgi:hypothetical protein